MSAGHHVSDAERSSTMRTPLPVPLNDAEIEAFGREIGAIEDEVKADLGERDARYIRRLIKIQRSMALGGRVIIFASLACLPTWGHELAGWRVFLAIAGIGTLTLALAKILENMEIAHNVMHGQWDWMRDPEIQSGTWEWDNVCPSDQWKHSHNVVHHTWTNVLGKDRDVGYGMLRMSAQQRWTPFYLLQPLSSILMALLFEWFIALHDLEINRLLKGKKDRDTARRQWRDIRRKAARQAMKDYVLYPALAGPFFLYVLAANLMASVIRNVWTYVIIFCGHFPAGVHVFTPEQIEDETRAGWYVRQLLGSCNIRGGRLFHILSGNLSHQIEHHLFPDMPSNRYPEVAPRIEAICARYGLPYNTGSFTRQFGTTAIKIVCLALPVGRPFSAAAGRVASIGAQHSAG
jgi:NADPH-dependent stearoyl-CoA 9-desaturase